jgi:hypothetical protein
MNFNRHACTTGPQTPRRAEVVLAAVFSDGLPPESRLPAAPRARARRKAPAARRRAGRGRFSEAWQGRSRGEKGMTRLRNEPGQRCAFDAPLTWLSLVGLLLSRARLRFTRRLPVYQQRPSQWRCVSAPCPNPERTGRRPGVEPLSLLGEAQGQGLVSRSSGSRRPASPDCRCRPRGLAAREPR